MLQIIDGASPEGAVRLRPLRRAGFVRLCQSGEFAGCGGGGARVELVCGAVIERGVDPAHARQVALAAARLREGAGVAGRVAVGAAWAIDDYSMPRPDVRVAAVGGHWERGLPTTPLVVEVIRGGGGPDRAVRRELFARAALEEYWEVDGEAGCIVAWRDRDARRGSWGTSTRYGRGERAMHATRPTLALAIAELTAPAPGRTRPGSAPRRARSRTAAPAPRTR